MFSIFESALLRWTYLVSLQREVNGEDKLLIEIHLNLVGKKILKNCKIEPFLGFGVLVQIGTFWMYFCKYRRGWVMTSNSNLPEFAWNFKQRGNSSCFLGGTPIPKQRTKVKLYGINIATGEMSKAINPSYFNFKLR